MAMKNEQKGFSGNNPKNKLGTATSDPKPGLQDDSKFNQDNDDFTRAQDNLDGESNMSTGAESSGTPYEGPGRRTNYSDDIQDIDSRHSSGTNDRERSQITNSDEPSDDWTPRNL